MRGFSLAEIMLAVVFLSIACLGLVGVQIYALRAGTVNRQQHLASVVARSLLMERERTNRLSQEAFEGTVHQPRTTLTDPAGFAYTLDEATAGTGLKEIRVVVFYQNQGSEQKYPLRTLVYDGR